MFLSEQGGYSGENETEENVEGIEETRKWKY
jgi:hypothetical protein